MTDFNIRPLERSDREWVAHFLDESWGTTQIVSRGKAVYGHLLPGFMAERNMVPAEDDAEPEEDEVENIGLITVHIGGKRVRNHHIKQPVRVRWHRYRFGGGS